MAVTDSNLRGILAMLAAVTMFAISDTTLKVLGARYPSGQLMAVRGLFSVGLMAALVIATGHVRHLRGILRPFVLGRSAIEAVITILFLVAIPRLPLADITALLLATPIFMTIFVAVLGLETIGWRRWSAVGVGFFGVLLIAKPGAAGFDPFVLVALACSVLVAVRDLMTVRLGSQIPISVLTLATTIALTLIGGVIGLGESAMGKVWGAIPPGDLGLFALGALTMSLGNLGIIVAFRSGEVAVVSPFRYAVLVAAVAAGYLVFGDWPDEVAWIGIALIAATGIYTMHRERVRKRGRGGPHRETP